MERNNYNFICGFGRGKCKEITVKFPKCYKAIGEYILRYAPSSDGMAEKVLDTILGMMGGVATATLNVDARKLYDFFDENGIIIGVLASTNTIEATLFSRDSNTVYSTSASLGDKVMDVIDFSSDNGRENTERMIKELSAFWKAFEILETKLSKEDQDNDKEKQ